MYVGVRKFSPRVLVPTLLLSCVAGLEISHCEMVILFTLLSSPMAQR